LDVKSAIGKIIEKNNLTEEEAYSVCKEIMEGNTPPSQIASLLTALRMKGETIQEITGFAKAMREKSVKIYPKKEYLVDTCGTGGDRVKTFNISTVSAFIAAGAGVNIAKHGNRSVTGKCGSADVLENLGIKIDAEPEVVEKCINEIGIGFLFAPKFHPAMKYATPVRREIGIRTIFNLLGPLTNPAQAKAQVLGVYSEELTEKIAEVLGKLGIEIAYVVYGEEGIDEISISSRTKITELNNGKIKTYYFEPENYGFKKIKIGEGGDVQKNSEILVSILKGEKIPERDMAILNAAFAILAGKKTSSLEEAIKMAEKSIDSGDALQKFELLKEYSKR
jgi:anthranilate phosphoribosyltransferase